MNKYFVSYVINMFNTQYGTIQNIKIGNMIVEMYGEFNFLDFQSYNSENGKNMVVINWIKL